MAASPVRGQHDRQPDWEPDEREVDVRAQLARPAFSRVADLHVRYLLYGELERHRESMARLEHGMKSVEAIANALT